MADPLSSTGLTEVQAMVRRFRLGKFKPHMKRCLTVPAPFTDLGMSIVHTKRRGTLIRENNGDLLNPNMGLFNLYFLMSWVEHSFGARVEQTCPLIVSSGKLEIGTKYAYRVPMARNPEMFGKLYDIYTSNSQAAIPNQAPLWICSKLAGENPYGFIYQDEEGLDRVNLPSYTGYWKVKFEIRHVFAGLVSQFIEELRSEGFSYRFESRKLTLYFANSIGASLGLPPAAHHMDRLHRLGWADQGTTTRDLLSKMSLSVPNWDDQRYDDEVSDSDDWELLSDYGYGSAVEEDNTSVRTEFSIDQHGDKIDSNSDNF